jgi:hypothetical protein
MTTFTPKYEIFDDALKPHCRILYEKHLNYSFRYEVSERCLVTSNRVISFNLEQICPSEKKCLDGKCGEYLCSLQEEEFTTDCFEWSSYYTDPEPAVLRGKKVEIGLDGVIHVVNVKVHDKSLDMNWRRLRNMARPIVDEALGRLAMDGNWQKSPMRIDLGIMLVDNKRLRVDENSFFETQNNGDSDSKDLERSEKLWSEGKEKRVKKSINDENTPPAEKNVAAVSTHNKKNKMEEKRSDEEDDESRSELCELCFDDPCVWITKKEDMLNYDDDEHEHLPLSAWPPSNVRRKKIYRQMALYINSGPSGRGVRTELPKCVVDGCRECFPSPTFMGFKEN